MRARREACAQLCQIPLPHRPSNPLHPPRALPRARARGVAPNRMGVSLPPRPASNLVVYLQRVSFRVFPRRAPNPPHVRQRWQCVLYVRAAGPISVCIYTPHTASAHPPPTRAPLPSPETAPSPEGGLASPHALRPRRHRPQPSSGLHARRSHPAHMNRHIRTRRTAPPLPSTHAEPGGSPLAPRPNNYRHTHTPRTAAAAASTVLLCPTGRV